MDIKYLFKNILLLPLAILLPFSLIAQEVELKKVFMGELIAANVNTNQGFKINNSPTIYPNSFVIKDTENNFLNSKDIETLGFYKYELSKGNLFKEVSKNIIDKDNFEKSNRLKLVFFESSNSYMISNGGLVVTFNSIVNELSFSKEFDLIFQFNIGNSSFFIANSTNKLELLLENIKVDPRVKEVKLDLIDPFITTQ